MKSHLSKLLLLSVLVVSLFSCKKIIQNIFSGLEFTAPDVSLTVPAIPIVAGSEMQLPPIDQHINLDSIIKANTLNAFGVDIVKSVNIKSIKITITNPDDLNNLSNFETARLSLTSNTNSTPGDIANITFPTTNTSTYTYIPATKTDFSSYLKGTTLTYHVYAKNRKITTKDLNMVISVQLSVN